MCHSEATDGIRLRRTSCWDRHLSAVGLLWSLPNTLLGLLLCLLSVALPRPQRGLLVAQSPRGFAWLFVGRRGFSAVTFGRVVLACGGELDQATLVHETHHVWQYERLGPFFLPLYLYQHFRRGYAGNPFELEAARCAADWQAISQRPS